MKTITKTFYVSDTDLKDISQNEHLDNCEDVLLNTKKELHYKNQIQISWQEPEKKIEISESEVDEIFHELKWDLKSIGVLILKQKLFGNREG